MKKWVLWILVAAVSIGVFTGVFFLYRNLSEDFEKKELEELENNLQVSSPESKPEEKPDNKPKPDNDNKDPKPSEDKKPKPIPNPAPDITVVNMKGEKVKLSDLRGKAVVLNFWTTWCGFCKKEMPDFQQMYEKYGEEVHFVMLNGGETADAVKNFTKAYGYTFPTYCDPTGEAARTYGVTGFPITFFINPEGSLVVKKPGGLDAKKIEMFIKAVK